MMILLLALLHIVQIKPPIMEGFMSSRTHKKEWVCYYFIQCNNNNILWDFNLIWWNSARIISTSPAKDEYLSASLARKMKAKQLTVKISCGQFTSILLYVFIMAKAILIKHLFNIFNLDLFYTVIQEIFFIKNFQLKSFRACSKMKILY